MPEFLISCEYATCTVPQACRVAFSGLDDLVTSPAGWEPGALNLAQAFAMRLRTPLVHTEITRLLLDIEQSGDDRWSRHSLSLPATTQSMLNERHDKAYRSQLDARITQSVRGGGQLLHLMVHTDADTRGQVVIETPRGSVLSHQFGAAWHERMKHEELPVRHLSDGAGTFLSRSLMESHAGTGYAQVRLSVSQGFFLEGQPWPWTTLKNHLLDTLVMATRREVPPLMISDPESSSIAPR